MPGAVTTDASSTDEFTGASSPSYVPKAVSKHQCCPSLPYFPLFKDRAFYAAWGGVGIWGLFPPGKEIRPVPG